MDSLKTKIRSVPDFPKAGILFYDITTLLRDKQGFRHTIDALVEPFADESIDIVVGVESRGFIIGGAVKGREIYGKMPTLTVSGPDDTGQGRWIPTTSVDEFAATLATWFGVSATDLSIVLPNIGRFAKPNLGFLA